MNIFKKRYLSLFIFLFFCVPGFLIPLGAESIDDPGFKFTLEKFIKFRLHNPSSAELDKWIEKLSEYYFQKADKRRSGFTYDYCRYLMLKPDSENFEKIMSRITSGKIYAIQNKANFLVANEYKKRKPSDPNIIKLTPDKIASNELKYLKTIYISNKVKESIGRAKLNGVSEVLINKLELLKSEIDEFDQLNLSERKKCKNFLQKYPKANYRWIIENEIFSSIYNEGMKISETNLPAIVFWLPKKKVDKFYNKIYGELQELSKKSKDNSETEKLLKPWILCSTYKLKSHTEKIFLADIFSWMAELKLKMKELQIASILNYTSAAITHTCLKTLFFRISLGSFSSGRRGRYGGTQNFLNKSRQNMRKAINNIKNIRSLLFTLGKSAHYYGTIQFFKKLNVMLKEKNEEKNNPGEGTRNLKVTLKYKKEPEYINAINILSKLLEIDNNCWPVLYAFNSFPEKKPLEKIVLMPRFYDYEVNIEKYLKKFKNDALDTAQSWLKSSSDEKKIERAYFILGFFKVKSTSIPVLTLPDSNKYWCYYNVRINNEAEKYKQKLITAAARRDKIALVLYSRVAGTDETPENLKKWLLSEIKKKKYRNGQSLHIFYTVIKNLNSKDKTKIIDSMYKSYNLDWATVASQFYKLEIPKELNEEYIRKILEEGIPNKKLDLIKHIIDKKLTQYISYISGYLEGGYYGKKDKKLLSKQIKNLYVKDIIVGRNQRINYAAVNRVVKKTELKYKAFFIKSAASGLNLLSFDKAIDVIKKRFLNDDNLCLTGARWILTNFEARKIEGKPTFEYVTAKSDIQKAVLYFLKTYFSKQQNFDNYMEMVNRLKKSDKWVQLVTLNAQFGNKAAVNIENTGKVEKIKNPLKESDLSILRSNVRLRYLNIINRAKK